MSQRKGVRSIPSTVEFAPILCRGKRVQVKDIVWNYNESKRLQSGVVIEVDCRNRKVKVYMTGGQGIVTLTEHEMNRGPDDYRGDSGVWSHAASQVREVWHAYNLKERQGDVRRAERELAEAERELRRKRAELAHFETRHAQAKTVGAYFRKHASAARAIVAELENGGASAFKRKRDNRKFA